ncbi:MULTISPECIES: hypothetical protein [unclassified Prochlorococcus]|uniref:hypothetical protein n=1 Tax=unclassified Prochlorococcus TaxID=2627481 RepID=UPI000533A77D|nr:MULTISPECIES: hypothetical protein [unclassified Prochlorococcus]KGG29265.1 hypothetical protein EV13_1214 [Prochlorococcus sp. MIT 0702]
MSLIQPFCFSLGVRSFDALAFYLGVVIATGLAVDKLYWQSFHVWFDQFPKGLPLGQ